MIFSGAYVPLTKEGRIIVDGILASCYADFHQDLAHVAMIPMQPFSKVMGLILGNDTGFPVYVNIAMRTGHADATRWTILGLMITFSLEIVLWD